MLAGLQAVARDREMRLLRRGRDIDDADFGIPDDIVLV
jgi:hypothetical protein